MKKHGSFAALVVSIIFFTSAGFAQDSTLIKLKNHFALQFQLGDNIRLTSFEGFTISGKYHLSKFAIRAGIEAGNFNTKSNNRNFTADTLTSSTEEENHGINIRINLQGLYYFNVYKDVAAYTGGGPFFAFYKRNKTAYYNYSSPEKKIQKENSTEIGLTALIGVEWFVKENIGLSAEYGINFSNYHMTIDLISEPINGSNTPKTFNSAEYKIFQVYANSAKLGIVIYS
ncbi:MAG: hypothetical protein K8H86_01700 [Ignavibacteriaceae bacterium]|nr:hypothetical protein [Ignavibacteriaceae bacterium]